MTTDDLSSHRGEAEALQALSAELDRIAQSARDKSARLKQKASGILPRIFKPRQPDWGSEELKLDYGGISSALRFLDAGGTQSFLYLGQIRDPKSGTFDDLMRAFQPTISLQLVDLANDQNIAFGLLLQQPSAMEKKKEAISLAESCRGYLARVDHRASLLAVTTRSMSSFIRDQIFRSLSTGDSARYQNWQEEYLAARSARTGRIAASNPAAIAEIEAATLIGLPGIVGHALRPNQRTINGVYFPQEHEEFIMKRLASMQAQAMAR